MRKFKVSRLDLMQAEGVNLVRLRNKYTPKLKRGDTIQFRFAWGQEPTFQNTGTVTRAAKNDAWADVVTIFSRKRVPREFLRKVSNITVHLNGAN